MKIDILKILDGVLETLDERDSKVIRMRYGLGTKKPMNLREIGETYNLTRERVRQIETEVINKLLSNECVERLSSSIEEMKKVFVGCGGFLANETMFENMSVTSEKEKRYINFLLDLAEEFHYFKENNHVKEFWALDPSAGNEVTKRVMDFNNLIEADKEKVFTEKEIHGLANKVKKLDKKVQRDEFLNLSNRLASNKFGEYGSKSNAQVCLSNVNGYMCFVLDRHGPSMHFEEIAKKVGEYKGKNVRSNVCHNELVKSNRFILVGRGMYSINKGDNNLGKTASEAIYSLIKKFGPMSINEVEKELGKIYSFKTNTIYQALINESKFSKIKDNKYNIVI